MFISPKTIWATSICPETVWAEALSTSVAAWWLLLLSLPVPLLTTNPSFAEMSRQPEGFWTTITGVVVAAHVLSLRDGRALPRIGALLLSVFLWGCIGGELASACPHWHGLPINTGVGAYGSIALGNVRALFALSRWARADFTMWAGRRQRDRQRDKQRDRRRGVRGGGSGV